MNNAQPLTTSGQEDRQSRDVGFIDIIIILAKYKKIVVGFPIAVAVVAAAISLLLPEVFKATTKVLPPQQSQSGAAAILSQLGGLAGSAGMKSPNDLYIGMLKSRTIADNLIAKHGLKAVYDTTSDDKARKRLEDDTVISAGKDGLITIEVESEELKRAAPLANSYVSELLQLTKVLAVTEASQRRLFFEQQLERSKNNLASAEVALKGALDTRGVISVDAESRAIVETVGRLRAQISAKDIQLSSMQAFVTSTNPEYRRVAEELASLRAELGKLENGRPAEKTDSRGDAGGKQIGLENIKLLRDVKYHQMLYELLAKQYEMARLDEAKEPSMIQVLDIAVDPERKVKPKRALIVLFSTIVAFVLALCYAIVVELHRRSIGTPIGAEQWSEFRSHLRFKRTP